MSLWVTAQCLAYFDDMIKPPPLALAATHPLMRAAIESNTGHEGCGVYQACGVQVALLRSFEDFGFITYRSVLHTAAGEHLNAHTDLAWTTSGDLDVHRPEDDQAHRHHPAGADIGSGPHVTMDCCAAVPPCIRGSATAKAQLYAEAIRAPAEARVSLLSEDVATTTLDVTAHQSSDETTAEAMLQDGRPLSLTPSSLNSVPRFASEVTPSTVSLFSYPPSPSAAVRLPRTAGVAAPRPFFTEATPRAALPALRRVVRAPHAPRIPYRLLEAMAWWFWRPSTIAPLEYVGSAFVGTLPVVHNGTTLATLFTTSPRDQSGREGTDPDLVDADGSGQCDAKRPSLISLRIRGFSHLRSSVNTEPTVDLRAVAESAPLLQLLQLTGLSALHTRSFRTQPLPFRFLMHLDVSHAPIRSLDFLRRVDPPRDGVGASAVREEAAHNTTMSEKASPFPFLRVLNVSGISGITSIAPLAELPELVVLIAVAVLGLNDVSPLARCTKLEEVDLSRCSNLRSLAPLSDCPSLRALRAVACLGLDTIGDLLLGSRASRTLEYLNLYQCRLVTSLFGLDESDDRARVPLWDRDLQWQTGRWMAGHDFAPPPDVVHPHAPATERSASRATITPDDYTRTALRYLNIAVTGLRLQTCENIIQLEERGEPGARHYPSHILHWLSVLCPCLEQLIVSGCAPRAWQRPSGRVDVSVLLFEVQAEAAVSATRLRADALETVDLSPLCRLTRLRKLVARGLKRATFTAPVLPWWPSLPSRVAARRTTEMDAADHARPTCAMSLCWLDMEGTALAIPMTLTKTEKAAAASPTGATTRPHACQCEAPLDEEAVRAQLQRDTTVQWLRRLAHAFFCLDIPTVTVVDALAAHTMESAWPTDACTLQELLHTLVMAELWRPLSPTEVRNNGVGLSESHLDAVALSPQTPFIGFTMCTSSSRSTAQPGTRPTSRSGLFPPVTVASLPQPPTASRAASDVLGSYVARLHHLEVTSRFLTHQEASARDRDQAARCSSLRRHADASHASPCADQITVGDAVCDVGSPVDGVAECVHALSSAAARRTPFLVPMQLRRLTLKEPANCPTLGRQQPGSEPGAEEDSDESAMTVPNFDHNEGAGDGVVVYRRPEDFLTHSRTAPPLLRRPSHNDPSLDASYQGTNVATHTTSTLATSPFGEDGDRVKRRVDVFAFAALLQAFPFVEELTFYQCSHSLRSLTPILCLPRFWSAVAPLTHAHQQQQMRKTNQEQQAHEGATDDEVDGEDVQNELRRRALFEVSARAHDENAHASLSLAVTSPYITYYSLKVLDASLATRLTSLGPLAQCCPYLERVSLRSCLELHSLRGLHGAHRLRYLDARKTGITTVLGLAQGCPNLLCVDVSGCRKLTTLDGLRGATQLRYLRACRLPQLRTILDLDDDFHAQIACVASAADRMVHTSSSLSCSHRLPAPHLPKLVELDVCDCQELLSLASVGLAPRLERVTCASRQLVTLPLARVQCPALKQLSLYGVYKLASVAPLAGAPQLRELKLFTSAITHTDGLSTCPCLSFVELQTCMSLQTVAGLAGAGALSLLILDNSGVLDLGALETCPELEYISVVGCAFQATTRPRSDKTLATSDEVFSALRGTAQQTVRRLRERGVIVRESDAV